MVARLFHLGGALHNDPEEDSGNEDAGNEDGRHTNETIQRLLEIEDENKERMMIVTMFMITGDNNPA